MYVGPGLENSNNLSNKRVKTIYADLPKGVYKIRNKLQITPICKGQGLFRLSVGKPIHPKGEGVEVLQFTAKM